MNRVVLLVVLFFGIVSCGNLRQMSVRQETDASFSEALSDTASVELRVMSLIDRKVTESIERMLQQEIVIEKEELSQPDSSGRQYVRERSRTTVSTRTSEVKSLASADSSAYVMTADSTAASSDESFMTSSVELVEEKESVPAVSSSRRAVRWIFAGILVAVAIFMIIKSRGVLWK